MYEVDWIRSWILQIAGIIVLGALCDMIVPEGDMRKYVKMVIGLILAFSVIRPIVGIGGVKTEFKVPREPRTYAIDFQKKLSDVEQKEVINLYCRNLEEKIANEIQREQICEVWVDVEVNEETGANFGNITKVKVVLENVGTTANAEGVKALIRSKFGVDEKRVNVKIS